MKNVANVHFRMYYNGQNLIFERNYIGFLSMFQNVLFYYQDKTDIKEDIL